MCIIFCYIYGDHRKLHLLNHYFPTRRSSDLRIRKQRTGGGKRMKYRAGIVLAAAMTVSAGGINSVPTAEENVNARWADVQADYQRRANLIPKIGRAHV